MVPDLRRTIGNHQAGRHDPTTRVGATSAWRATITPDGPATIHVWLERDEVRHESWGPGGPWCLARLDNFLARRDDPDRLVPLDPVVEAAVRATPYVRVSASFGVWHSLIPTVIAQRVTSGEALVSWYRVARALGEPAPGPGGLRLPPAPATVARLPYWWFHRFGIERQRADTLRRAARHADRLDRLAATDPAEASRVLELIPG